MALAVVAGAAALAAVPSPAVAGKSVKYRGIHPLPPHAGEFCYIDFVHVHAQPPSDMRAYRVRSNQEHLFVGDEAALGYSGPKHPYFGPHPVAVVGVPATEPLYCYLRGAHYHAQAPAPSGSLTVKDGVAWFTGPFPPEFERDRFNVWVNDMRPISGYGPPRVSLGDAPPGYRLPAGVDAPPVLPPAAPTGAPAGTSVGKKNSRNAKIGKHGTASAPAPKSGARAAGGTP